MKSGSRFDKRRVLQRQNFSFPRFLSLFCYLFATCAHDSQVKTHPAMGSQQFLEVKNAIERSCAHPGPVVALIQTNQGLELEALFSPDRKHFEAQVLGALGAGLAKIELQEEGKLKILPEDVDVSQVKTFLDLAEQMGPQKLFASLCGKLFLGEGVAEQGFEGQLSLGKRTLSFESSLESNTGGVELLSLFSKRFWFFKKEIARSQWIGEWSSENKVLPRSLRLLQSQSKTFPSESSFVIQDWILQTLSDPPAPSDNL